MPEAKGGAGLTLGDALSLLIVAGRYGLPAPLGETMLATVLLQRSGIELPEGVLTVAGYNETDAIAGKADGDGFVLTGTARRVPWARAAAAIAVLFTADGVTRVALVAPAACRLAEGRNLAGEPRDDVTFDGARVTGARVSALSREEAKSLGAVVRSAQIAGALQTTLELGVAYANDRVQFGKPIGKFQAVQQNLAVLAGQAAAAGAAADAAIEAAEKDLEALAIAVAKVRTGEAAGIGAGIAHQVHGAIGFTKEHALHHSTLRLYAWRDEFGNEAYWSRRLGDRVAAAGADRLWATITAI